jgi:predicted Zn-dependent peptidase
MIDRRSAPPHAEIKSIQLPQAINISLANGFPLTILNGVSQEVIKIDVVFTASKWNEPAIGLAHLTASMLEKGTSKMNAFQIADFFERYGASVEISSGFDFTTLSLYTPAKNLTQILPLFILLFTEPEFPESELIILKNLLIQNLSINNEKTSYVASKVFRQELFGKSHPYGSTIEEDHLKKLSSDNLKEFFKTHFKPAHVFVTGNVSPSIQKIINAELSVVNATHTKVNEKKSEDINSSAHKVHIEKKDSTQTSIRIGCRTINRSHPEYPGFILLNHILGGYFGSRLMKNIREEKGLTYGIYSSINALKKDAYLVIGADVNKNNKELAILEIKNELNKLASINIDEGEFKIAKNHLLGSLQLELASPFAVIEKIKIIQFYNLPSEFYSDLFKQIHSTSPGDLTHLTKKYLTESLLEVSVG